MSERRSRKEKPLPGGTRALGPVATTLLFENEGVRIWNLVVEPGQASPWHLHDLDYVLVTAEGVGLTIEYEDGTVESRETQVGRWAFHKHHTTHRVINHTNARYKNVLIEFKG